MRAGCERYDEALLMLVHGALEPRRAFLMRAHLALCPQCRARRGRLESVTRSLALTLANPRLGVRTFAHAPRAVWLSVGLLVALFTFLGLLVSSEVAASVRTPGPVVAPVALPQLPHCETRAER